MELAGVVEALQSSALASLLQGLASASVKPVPEGSGTLQYVAIPVKQLFPHDGQDVDNLMIVENESHYHFAIKGFAIERSEFALMRASQVNQTLLVGRVSVDLKSGSIGVDWVLGRRPEWNASLTEIEYVIAALLFVYYQEKLLFTQFHVQQQGAIVQSAMKPILDAAARTINDEIFPAIGSVLTRR